MAEYKRRESDKKKSLFKMITSPFTSVHRRKDTEKNGILKVNGRREIDLEQKIEKQFLNCLGKEGKAAAEILIMQIKSAELTWQHAAEFVAGDPDRDCVIRMLCFFAVNRRDEAITYVLRQHGQNPTLKDPKVRAVGNRLLSILYEDFIKHDGEGFEGAKEAMNDYESERRKILEEHTVLKSENAKLKAENEDLKRKQ